MNLPQLVTSLELSKRLRELGAPQRSIFYWRSPLPHHGWPDWSLSDGELGHGSESISAYTSSELGELLPPLSGSGWISVEKLTNDWHVCYRTSSNAEKFSFDDPSQVNGMARLLIHLIEQGIIDPKTI